MPIEICTHCDVVKCRKWWQKYIMCFQCDPASPRKMPLDMHWKEWAEKHNIELVDMSKGDWFNGWK